MRKLLPFLLALVLAATAGAQTAPKFATFAHLYDVGSTSLTYCAARGQQGDPFGSALVGSARIKTVGSSTTVTEFTASTNPFTNLVVGDTLIVTDANGVTQRVILTAKASGASITVSTALTLTDSAGHQFTWLDQSCGTTADDGWISISGGKTGTLTVQYESGDLTALVVRFECKSGSVGSQPVIVYPGESSDCGIGGTLSTDRCSYATPGITARLSAVVAPNPFTQCRVGLAYVTADGGTRDEITATIAVTP
jgi:hypothetical protein